MRSPEIAAEYSTMLRWVLAELDMTQYSLSLRSNVGPVTINRLVNGVRAPTEEQALRIALGILLPPARRKMANAMLETAGIHVLTLSEDGGDDDDKYGKRPVLPRR